MNESRQTPAAPVGFTAPLAFRSENLDRVPDSAGVHIVWDHDGSPLYVGYSRSQRSRLRQHLSGDRIASVLHDNVGRQLDSELDHEATKEEIRAYLNECLFSWRESGNPEALKAQLMDELKPRFNKVYPSVTNGEYSPSAGSAGWDEFIKWVRRFATWENFDAEERDYKLEIARNLGVARDAVRSEDSGWFVAVKRAFGQPNNLTFYIAHSRFLDWAEGSGDDARVALVDLWSEAPPLEARLLRFFEALPSDSVKAPGNRTNIASFLLMGLDPTTHVIYKASLYRKAFDLTGYGRPEDSRNETERYLHAMGFLDRLIKEAAKRDLVLRDRLDAQGAMWGVLKGSALDELMSPEERDQLRLYRGAAAHCWWVNQGITYENERNGGYVWASQEARDGKALAHHVNVKKLKRGDVILHYSKGFIRALGTVERGGKEAPRPDNRPEVKSERPGYLAKVAYYELVKPIALEDTPVERRIDHGVPFTKHGSVAQVYLYPLKQRFSDFLRKSFADRWPEGSPWAPPSTQVWIFQANPEQWDLEEWLAENEPGVEDTWTVARYRNEMRAGDTVILWMSGRDAGAYALAELTDPPMKRPRPDFRPERADGSDEEWCVPLRLKRILDEPILRRDLKQHELLQDLAVIRQPQATNFKVTPEEWEVLAAMMGEAQPRGDLAALVQQFMRETGYPRERDKKFQRERVELRRSLTQDALAEPRADQFRRLAGPAGGSPGPQSSFMALVQDEQGVERVAEAARYLLYGEGELADRFDEVMSGSMALRGMKEAVLTKMLSVAFPSEWVPAYVSKGEYGKRSMLKALGLPAPPKNLSAGHEAEETNRSLRDPLRPFFGDDCWGMLALAWWALKPPVIDDDEIDDTPETMEALARRLFLDVNFIRDIQKLLEDKRQVVFYGPPGTGKTYVARELATFFTTEPEGVRKVQFHPSYAYEDFVEGYRPRIGDGESGFRLVDGPLKQIAKRAQTSPGRHVLIIDEINRGNVAKVLGELYYLLEYRDEEISLQYSDELFSLPEDLWLIGTMNTADRSIALVDAALRRRFHFVPFFPDEPPIKDLLRNWLKANRPEMLWVAGLVDKANEELGDRHMAIGPSHFLRKDLDESWVRTIWKHSILPYIEEQHFGEPGEVKRFLLDRLRSKEEPGTAEQESGAVDEVPGPEGE